MVLPMWVAGLGAAGAGVQQALQRRQDQQRQDKYRQQMIDALRQRTQNTPGGLGATPPGAYGPQNWGAQNQTAGGVVHDQWGNPIGPTGQPAQGGQAAMPTAADVGAPAAPDPLSTELFSPSATPLPGMSPGQPITGLGGPSQATPPGGAAYQAPPQAPPQGPSEDALMQALFSAQY